MAKRALEIGDTAYLLVSGEVKYFGKAESLLHEPELCSMYLGIKESASKDKDFELSVSDEGSEDN
jgi:ABC-type lipopolysaccharide export system ATPase subunit